MPKSKGPICHDCGVKEGQIHKFGCDMERCPFCGMQLITCDCKYEKLGYKFDPQKENCGLPKAVYEKGLPKKQQDQWIKMLEEKGRKPYIEYPIRCARCGMAWPPFFPMPPEDRMMLLGPEMQGYTLCQGCYKEIKAIIEKNSGKKKR